MRARLSWWLVLLALTVMWGSSYLLIKIALVGFTPEQLAGARIILAALILLFAMIFSGQAFPRDLRSWGFFLAIAVIGNCLPFTLIAWGQQQVESGLAGILAAITPLCVVLIGHFVLPEGRLKLSQMAGFLVGFSGVVVLMGPESLLGLGGDSSHLWSQFAVIAGAFCYALATVITAKMPANQPLVASASVMFLAGPIMMPATIPALELMPEIPLKSILAVVTLGAIGTAITSILYFWLVARAGARFTSLLNYLVPIWAVTLGILVLGEQLRITSIIALMLIIGGVLLTQHQSGRAAV
ncbi:MAG: DMT family transporter [Gammaproteobacteria bacterium]|nr:DMT family transporter [Gammaproteobacteria bacterium]